MRQPKAGPSLLLFMASVVALCVSARMSYAQALNAASASASASAQVPSTAVPHSDAASGTAVQYAAAATAGNPPAGDTTLIQIQVRVLSIDPAKNSVKVQRQQGSVDEIAFDPALVKVASFRVGDNLGIGYRNAQLTRIGEMTPTAIRERHESTIAWPQTNGIVASTRRVEVVATVQNIDAARRQITLRGPQQADTVDLPPGISLDGVKPGDTVRAEFASTVAVQVQSRASQ